MRKNGRACRRMQYSIPSSFRVVRLFVMLMFTGPERRFHACDLYAMRSVCHVTAVNCPTVRRTSHFNDQHLGGLSPAFLSSFFLKPAATATAFRSSHEQTTNRYTKCQLEFQALLF